MSVGIIRRVTVFAPRCTTKSGVLKNALDWIVSSGELIDKPIALTNASRRDTRVGVAGGIADGDVGARDSRRVEHDSA